jgi:4-hydroxyphenylpyruvate dioxygenase
VFVFKTPLNPSGHEEWNKEYAIHGDGVKDVAFTVDDAAGIYKKAVDRGATSVKEPYELKDENGSVIMASVKTYGDTTHTFVQRNEYKGKFLPGFKDHFLTEPFNKVMPQPDLQFIDHCVGN